MSNQNSYPTYSGGGGQKDLNNQSLGTKENPKSSKSLDSKSKNPNKIQTTIQDSKTQLESNPKNLAKLESKKIQRAKSTCTQKSTKSKESNKAKTLIRTIPVSIALASALASNAVAAIPGGSGTLTDETIVSGGGKPTIVVNGNYSNGTITNGTATITNGSAWQINGTHTIINGWNMINGSQAGQRENTNGTAVNGGVEANGNMRWWLGQRRFEVFEGTSAGDLTINGNINILHSGSFWVNSAMQVSDSANAGTITFNGSVNRGESLGNAGTFLNLANSSNTAGVVIGQSGEMNVDAAAMIQMWNNSSLGIFRNRGIINVDQTMIRMTSGTSVEQMDFTSGSQTTAGNIVEIQNGASVGTITATGATVSGNITLAGTGSITNGISLTNASNMTGNITLANTASIDNISISGNNATLAGNITIGTARGNSASIGNITISNGGTYAGTIHTKN